LDLKKTKKKSAKTRNSSATTPSPKKTSAKTASTPGIKRLTTKPTETDLETEIHYALRVGFPWIPATDLKHQIRFQFNVGHAVLTNDGEETYRAEGRADIIVEAYGKPVAVMELKRRGNPLTPQDGSQGLSYARLLDHMPPLVVVTNGQDVRWLETHTRKEWKPSNDLEAEFKKLVEAASRVAAVDVKGAVQVLLGTGSALWATALRQATAASLDALSGAWSDPLVPFVPNFLIPREATQEVLAQLRSGARAVIVSGAPLAGKSNVLRELAAETESAADLVVLFIEADDHGPGLFLQLANLLGSTLAWPVSPDEVRTWLRRLSKADGPALVLAIDGPGENLEIRKDIAELCAAYYGQGLRMVIALDEATVPGFTKNASARKTTALGRIAKIVEIAPLNDAEFAEAVQLLWDHRIGFQRGVSAAAEMRAPWVLRATAATVTEDPGYQKGDWAAILPPLLGLNLIAHARRRFKDPELRRRLREVAKAVLKDSLDAKRPIGLILEAVGLFLVRNKTLEGFLSRADIDELISAGVLKPGMHDSGEAVLFIYLPELLASELSRLLADELASQIGASADQAAAWLVKASSLLPLGDLVAAQAILDAGSSGVVTLDFINALVALRPREQGVSPGTELALHVPGRGLVRLEFQQDGSLVWTENGQRSVLQPGEDENLGGLIDVGGWLLLSHVASRPFAFPSADGKSEVRLDPPLLLKLGTCRCILRGAQNDPKKNAVLVHDVPGQGTVVCHKAGIIEPITMAISKHLASNGPDATKWLRQAVELRSFPLLMRIYIALQHIGSANTAHAAWAKEMMNKIVKPALNSFPSLH
jgi:hypothetical protein